MKEYLEGRNLITKLQAKHDLLQKTLGESEYGNSAGGLAMGGGRPSPEPPPLSPVGLILLYECISFPSLFDVKHTAPVTA